MLSLVLIIIYLLKGQLFILYFYLPFFVLLFLSICEILYKQHIYILI